jgi:glycosyltransferase involved in cell wall biosynthesis
MAAGREAYSSLGSVESLFERATCNLDLVRTRADPWQDPDAWRLELQRLPAPPGVVLDLADAFLHVDLWPEVPTVLLALGNMPSGATMLFLHRTKLKSSDMLLVNCEADRRIFERTLPGVRPRLGLLPFAVDVEHFRPRSDGERAEARRGFGLPEDAFVMVYAGRLDIQKGLHLLLLLLARLRREVGEVRLVLAGRFGQLEIPALGLSNRGYEATLMELADRLGVSRSLSLTGPLEASELACLYAGCDVYVNASTHQNENFGLAVVEAMSAGLPAVVSHWGGQQDTVEHGRSGFHMPTWMTGRGPRVNLEPGFLGLSRLALEPELRQAMGRGARERVLARYSPQRFAANLRALLEQAAAVPEDPQPGRRFAFHPLAQRLYLGNLYRTFRREQGRPAPSRGAFLRHEDYPVYRFFQGPYASGDVSQLDPGSVCRWRPSAMAEATGERRLVDRDPAWGSSLEPSDAQWRAWQDFVAGRETAADSPRDQAARTLAEAGMLLPG